MALTQPTTNEMHQAEQEILAQPSDGKKMPMSRISNDAILNKLQNKLSGLALATVPCILGPFKVHHALSIGELAWTSCPRWYMTAWTRTHWSLPLINCNWQTPLLKNIKVPSGYSTMNVSRLISVPDIKVAPGVKSHDYHVLLTQMIAVGIWNILPVNVWKAIMNFCFFFNAIGQKVLSEEALESLKKALWNFMLPRDVFSTCLFRYQRPFHNSSY
jgi:hypothetical protein